ncbi:MAG: anti-sigma factor domain-containing protein [Ginsengibacter sp.]
MNKEDIISSGLLEMYVLGIASPGERETVEECLVQNPHLLREIENIEDSLITYAQSAAPTPDAGVKNRIKERIRIEQDYKPRSQHSGIVRQMKPVPLIYKLIAAAIVIFLIESVILNYSFYNKYKSTSAELASTKDQLTKELDANTVMSSQMNVMTDKNALPVVLNGTPKAPEAVAKIFWMKNTGAVYVDPSDLPSVPEGKQYQLWAIVNGAPVDAGLIQTKKGNYRIQKMKSFGQAQAFAITLEKTGGSEKPTMDEMIVMAKM